MLMNDGYRLTLIPIVTNNYPPINPPLPICPSEGSELLDGEPL